MSFDDDLTIPHHEPIKMPEEGIEFYECQKCGEYNILKNKPHARRTTRVRHYRVDDVVNASLRKYAALNNLSINYAIMSLLMNAKTSNVNYIVNERRFVEKLPLKKKNKQNRSTNHGNNR